jgi:hypothetical protein
MYRKITITLSMMHFSTLLILHLCHQKGNRVHMIDLNKIKFKKTEKLIKINILDKVEEQVNVKEWAQENYLVLECR